MNEPFAGNIFEEGHLKIIPGIAGEENLVPFYDIVQKVIRAVDDDTVIFWEPVSILNLPFIVIFGKNITIHPQVELILLFS